MIAHCLEEKPLEACGLLVGAADRAERGYAVDNELRSPVLYRVDREQMLTVLTETEQARQNLVAIYHSHVKTAPIPSETDIKIAYWPEAFYLIVSLALREPEVRAYRIVDGQVTEHPLVILPEPGGEWRDLRRVAQREGEA
jgi:proteasome lid subunit RPN8/RPN11